MYAFKTAVLGYAGRRVAGGADDRSRPARSRRWRRRIWRARERSRRRFTTTPPIARGSRRRTGTSKQGIGAQRGAHARHRGDGCGAGRGGESALAQHERGHPRAAERHPAVRRHIERDAARGRVADDRRSIAARRRRSASRRRNTPSIRPRSPARWTPFPTTTSRSPRSTSTARNASRKGQTQQRRRPTTSRIARR